MVFLQENTAELCLSCRSAWKFMEGQEQLADVVIVIAEAGWNVDPNP